MAAPTTVRAPRAALVPGRTPLRIGPVSTVVRLRAAAVVVVGLVVVVLALAVNLGLGEYPISVPDVLAVLLGGGNGGQRLVVLDLRLPRSLTGALVGAALAVSGAITQSIARNPLASPDIIGLTAGATVGAVLVIVFAGAGGAVGGATAAVGIPVAALLGGLLTAALIYGLAWRRGLQGFRLVLVGVGVNAMLVALIQWMLVVTGVYQAARAYVWLNGSLNGRGWEHVWPVAVALAVLVPAALVLAHVLGALQYGDDTARGLGIRVDRSRSVLLLVAVCLASVAAAAAGPIAFVALVAPQIAQRLTGIARPPITGSLVVGAVLTVVADILARTALGGTELPVGIVTAVIGAPYLLFLLARHRRRSRG
ncbi:FecCD family ABC transporter permease [Pseudonocardia lacus]|uniref:FecCD family ABC transporter permease n=1 Tax=Pseudonocardia lacus TaxID=2835865 RepID=UPI001BDC9928|nr:iron chelate uptake ABC transporter family permease subunit [Pseudonocardia lacus]